MRKVRRALPKVAQVVDVLVPGRPRPVKHKRQPRRRQPDDSALVARILAAVREHPKMVWQLAAELYSPERSDERDPRADELYRVVERNSDRLWFAMGPGWIFHVVDRQNPPSDCPLVVPVPSLRQGKRVAGNTRPDDRPFARTRVYTSLSEAGLLPTGAERFVFKRMEWAWVSPGNAKLIDKYPDKWELAEDGTPTITVSVEAIDDVSRLFDGQRLGDWLATVQQPKKKTTRQARTAPRPTQVELF